jgi:protease I
MRAVILVENGVQDQEMYPIIYRFQEEEIEVDIASPTLEARKCKYGVPFTPTITTEKMNPHFYDIAYIGGGWESPEKIRQDEHSLKLIQKMHEKGKLICAQCHGPWVLISAGIMKGRKGTCYKGMKDDLINAGCEYIDAPVVVDGNIITAPHYKNNPDFMREVIKASKNIETDPYGKFSA